MKRYLIPLILILALSIASGYTTWENYNGLESQGKTNAIGDVISSSYSSSKVDFNASTLTYMQGNQTLIGDFVPNNDYMEIIMMGRNDVGRLSLWNYTLGNIALFSVITGNYYLYSISSIDWDGDGVLELVASTSNSSQGKVNIIGFYPNGSNYLITSVDITFDTRYKPIKCKDPYCYVADTRNNLYKITKGTGSVTSLNFGSYTTNLGTGYNRLEPQLTIDECVPDETGYEALITGDLDNDGYYNEIGVVNVDTMTLLGVIDTPTEFEMTRVGDLVTLPTVWNITNMQLFRSPTCGQIDGKPYIATQSFGSRNTVVSGYQRCLYNAQTNLINTTTLVSMYSYNHTNQRSEATSCDITLNGAVKPTEPIFLDEYGSNYDNLYIGYGYRPYSSSNRFSWVYVLNSTLSVMSLLDTVQFANFDPSQRMYGWDIDNNGNPELVMPYGQVLDVNANNTLSLYYQFIYSVTSSYPMLYWVAVEDDTSYADYLGVSSLPSLHWYSNVLGTISGGNATPNATINVIFNETFTNSYFLFGSNPDCSNGSYFNIGTGNTLSVDNLWYCHKNINGSVIVSATSNTSRINTDAGMEYESNNVNGANPNWFTLSSFMSPTEDFSLNTTISFYCDMANLDNRSYAYFHLGDTFNSNHPTIALNDNGCDNSSNLPINASCCEMTTIMGYDCSNNQAQFNATVFDIVNICSGLGEGDFLNMEQIDVLLWKNFTSSDRMFFDDLLIYETQTIGNQMPVITSNTPSPTESEINATVSWFVVVSDDDLTSQIYTGFDCDNDGSLEYPLTLRNLSSVGFNCTYPTTGTKTSKAYATDLFHYSSQNATLTNTVSVVDSGLPYGVDCSGFIAPTCIGSCEYYDDFGYTQSIYCNDWQGTSTNRTPTDGKFYLVGMSDYELMYLNRVSTPISNVDYSTFSFEYDMNMSSNARYSFQIYDKNIDKLVTQFLVGDGEILVYDDIPPTETTVYAYNLYEEFKLKGTVNFNTGIILWEIGNATAETEVKDYGVSSAGYYLFYWIYGSSLNGSIDNFLIETGIEQTLNITPDVNLTENPTYLDTGNFCAINWTTRRFIDEECDDRGYNIPEGLEQVCLVRACFSDTFSWIFYSAQKNIFKTLIWVFAFILIAPLVVALLRRR